MFRFAPVFLALLAVLNASALASPETVSSARGRSMQQYRRQPYRRLPHTAILCHSWRLYRATLAPASVCLVSVGVALCVCGLTHNARKLQTCVPPLCRPLLAAGVAAVAAPTSLDPCPSWSDDYGFDCQLYEGADWCTSQGQPGAGWCQSSPPDSTCLPNAPNNKFGWGSFSEFLSASALTPGEACAGCGAPCSALPPARVANALPANCSDLATPDGSGVMWRDSWGYTCASYQHASFCVQADDGSWGEGGLWDVASFGRLKGYKWWAVRADGSVAKVHALEACCACGGGTTTTGAPPSLPPCADKAKWCRKRRCNKYSERNKKKCKKTCDVCEAPPPLAPPPSSPPPSSSPPCADKAKSCKKSKCKRYSEKKKKKKCMQTCDSCEAPLPPSLL